MYFVVVNEFALDQENDLDKKTSLREMAEGHIGEVMVKSNIMCKK